MGSYFLLAALACIGVLTLLAKFATPPVPAASLYGRAILLSAAGIPLFIILAALSTIGG